MIDIHCGNTIAMVYNGSVTPSQYDVMIADPPYSAHVHKNATSQSPGRGTRYRDLGFEHLTDELRHCICQAAANVRRWSLIYSDVESLASWRETAIQNGATYVRPMAWVRWSMPQLSGDRPTTGFELVTCYWGTSKGRKSWNGPGNLTHLAHTMNAETGEGDQLQDDEIIPAIAHKCLRGEKKHRAEKPLDQALDLVEWFSNPGETVFDPCAGSGTVGLACKLLGRNYVGIEKNPEWAYRAKCRIDRNKLSDRDSERFIRWETSRAELQKEKERMRAHTAGVRAKIDGAA